MNKEYYQDKLAKLNQKSQANLQKFLNSAFEMVAESQDINERIKEINDILKDAEKEEKVKKV